MMVSSLNVNKCFVRLLVQHLNYADLFTVQLL
jgi:hypothetical protein